MLLKPKFKIEAHWMF